MYFLRAIGLCFLALTWLSTANEEIPEDHYLWGEDVKLDTILGSRASSSLSASCTNDATHRNCWTKGYNINTDFDTSWPNTGRTVTYNFEITNTTCAPDGHHREACMRVNGQLPGPTLEANWGDHIVVNVKNSMEWNGTGLHWHGMRQYGTNDQDGVPGITECPIAPGDSKTYKFQATQYGTSWYHSHFGSQYGNGLFGGIKIHGPASANYDYDLGTYLVNDWFYQTIDQMDAVAFDSLQGGPFLNSSDSMLINGTNKNADNTTGSWATTTGLEHGKKYLLRIVNAATDANAIRVSLDNHKLTLISTDFVPIEPITVETLLVAIGQRYDVIITADQTKGNYWFRAYADGNCFGTSDNIGRSIFNYKGVKLDVPDSNQWTYPEDCLEPSPLKPWNSETVPSSSFISQATDLEINIVTEQTEVTTNNQSILVWGVNSSAIQVDWQKPTLQYVIDKNTSYPYTVNLIEIPKENVWTYWIFQATNGIATRAGVPHPIHLHGHDFYVLGQAREAIFDRNIDFPSLNFTNPPRRDVAFMPAYGWLVIAFKADNPGAWLVHCHIAFHLGEGMGLQFLEAKDKISLPGSDWKKTCTNWDKFWDGQHPYTLLGSGL